MPTQLIGNWNNVPDLNSLPWCVGPSWSCPSAPDHTAHTSYTVFPSCAGVYIFHRHLFSPIPYDQPFLSFIFPEFLSLFCDKLYGSRLCLVLDILFNAGSTGGVGCPDIRERELKIYPTWSHILFTLDLHSFRREDLGWKIYIPLLSFVQFQTFAILLHCWKDFHRLS